MKVTMKKKIGYADAEVQQSFEDIQEIIIEHYNRRYTIRPSVWKKASLRIMNRGGKAIAVHPVVMDIIDITG